MRVLCEIFIIKWQLRDHEGETSGFNWLTLSIRQTKRALSFVWLSIRVWFSQVRPVLLRRQLTPTEGPTEGGPVWIDTSEATRTGGAYGVDQEVQIRSQVQMLYAVFQAHSTAEDEIIWPALKAKQFAGGQDGTFVGKEGELVRELDYVEDHEDEERVSHYPQPL